MGWRAAKASGGASMPVDKGGSFAEGFASSFVPLISNAAASYAKNKQDERMLLMKEKLLRERETIAAARKASTTGAAKAKADAKVVRTAQGVMDSMGIANTPANLQSVISSVISNDNDGSQTIKMLQGEISSGATVYEPGPPVGDTGTPAQALPSASPEDGASLTPPETVLTDDLAEVAPTEAVDTEMSTLQSAAEPVTEEEAAIAEVDEDADASDGVQVASLDPTELMVEIATGNYPASSAESGEEIAIRVADASGNVGGAEAVTLDDPEVSTLPQQQQVGVLRFTGSVTPINELKDATDIAINLEALGERTDSFAVDYRTSAANILAEITKLPAIATMSRSELSLYVNGGYQEFDGVVTNDNLDAHLKQARAFLTNPQSMPPIPADLAAQQALMVDIKSGVYGRVENIPSNYTTNLATFINENETKVRLGDSLSVPSLLGSSLTDLEALNKVLVDSGASNTIVASLISTRTEQKDNVEFLTFSEGVDTSKEAISELQRAIESGASQKTITGLEKLRDLLATKEREQTLLESGTAATAFMATVRSPEGTNVVRQVIRNPDNSYILADGSVPEGVMPMTETMIDKWKKIDTEHSTIINKSNETLTSLTEGLRNASNVLSIAEGTPDVLNLGGDAAQLVTGAVRAATSVTGVVKDLFEGQGEDFVLTAKDVNSALAEKGLLKEGASFTESGVDALVSSSVQDLAGATSMFEGQMVLLAFRMGALEGQSGNAMSNKDFDRLMGIIATSNGSVETFRSKIHTYMQDKIKGYDDRVVLVNRELDSFETTFSVDMSDLVPDSNTFVNARNDDQLTASYQFFKGPLATSEPAVTAGDVGEAYEKLVNDPGALKALQSNFTVLSGRDDGALEGYISQEANRLGVSVEQLTKIMQQKGDN